MSDVCQLWPISKDEENGAKLQGLTMGKVNGSLIVGKIYGLICRVAVISTPNKVISPKYFCNLVRDKRNIKNWKRTKRFCLREIKRITREKIDQLFKTRNLPCTYVARFIDPSKNILQYTDYSFLYCLVEQGIILCKSFKSILN